MYPMITMNPPLSPLEIMRSFLEKQPPDALFRYAATSKLDGVPIVSIADFTLEPGDLDTEEIQRRKKTLAKYYPRKDGKKDTF